MSMSADDWSKGQRIQVNRCPLCTGAPAGPPDVFVRADDEAQFSDIWHYDRCSICRSLYLRDRPDTESLPRAYAEYFTHHAPVDSSEGESTAWKQRWINGYLRIRFGVDRPHYSRAGGALFALVPPVAWMLNVHGRNIPKNFCHSGKRLLDVGCGNGEFLRRAMEMGLRCSGCEPDQAAAELCRKEGLDVLHGDAFDPSLDPLRFDVITLNHVIEHVEDPAHLIVRLHTLLQPGGVLWMGLPNPSAIGIGVFGAGWKGLHPPFHLAIPDQRVLKRWLSAAGFEDIRCLRRGLQSPGLWGESSRIFERETGRRAGWRRLFKPIADALASLSPRYSEETIIVARRKAAT